MRKIVVPVRQNPTDRGGLSDESDDFHLCAASAGQRVDVIDFVDELRPSFAHRAFRRARLAFSFSLVLHGVATMRHGGARAVCIGPIEMDEMLVGFGDVDEHAGEKLQRIDRLAVVDLLSGFGLINEEAGFGMIAKAGQVHWRSVQVASESMEPFGVVGIDGRVIMNVETRMSPRQKQVDALFGDEVQVSEQCEDLMTKDELCFVGVDIGDGMPLPVGEENPAGDDGMDVRIPF